ncbi:hypothetical protein ERJ75_000975500 [Trypanosoma vivax]|uniref:Uncharacterized protein n=1 Tax=Trypanosoma vivax (strain Y486) TaxID=1055687 RepID=G0U6P2_TRYVY|nr:hypothetical protein TRVL_01935 [Trypanosoma vivax]KAH8611511.1 hypothetical protein ERJ75_000975500 [Trypanosoma vivax]CCC51546.1 conserved hypothetical protein [Trypanosoma vivax Y486]
MPQKATKSKKRSRRSGSEESGNSQDGKKSAPSALSKFEEFDVAEVLQKEREAEQALSDGRLVDTGVVDDFGASALAPVTPPSAGEALEIPVAAIPQLIPPEPLRDLPPDEEFVPLPTLQVVPMMNRVSEAQSGLLKEPAPPASIHRVTVPGAPVPAMPTALMELLSA